jgi:hypothetical protein
VYLAGKFFAQETIINVPVSCAFPVYAASVGFSRFFQLFICPTATEASIVLKSEGLA